MTNIWLLYRAMKHDYPIGCRVCLLEDDYIPETPKGLEGRVMSYELSFMPYKTSRRYLVALVALMDDNTTIFAEPWKVRRV